MPTYDKSIKVNVNSRHKERSVTLKLGVTESGEEVLACEVAVPSFLGGKSFGTCKGVLNVTEVLGEKKAAVVQELFDSVCDKIAREAKI